MSGRALIFKRGDTAALGVTYTVDGEAQAVGDYDVRAQIRTESDGVLVGEFTFTGSGTRYAGVIAAEDTADWPATLGVCDVEIITVGDVVASTQTVPVVIRADVTRDDP